ncbi:MAG: hypothetical protein IT165_25210 [Bryobacterales bacterium]|nr:hypothetical protein [Bryobacterales bacterium]
MPEVATPNQAEREFETGSDEFFKSHSELTAANAKRTYDEYQHAGLEHIRNNQRLFDQAASNLQTQLASINNITTQHLQNAVAAAHQINQNAIETANMTAKQAVKHADVAADAMWNPVQQGTADTLTATGYTPNRAVDTATAGVSVSAEAVAAAVAKQVDATVTPVVAVLQQLIQALATATTAIANTVNQTQPKS